MAPVNRRIYTHLGFLAAGALLGMCLWKATAPEADLAEGRKDPRAEQASALRSADRISGDGDRTGTELLKTIAPDLFNTDKAGFRGREITFGTYMREAAPKLLKAADALPPADDVAAAAIQAVAQLGIMRDSGADNSDFFARMTEVQSRLIHWMRQDPAAALAYIHKNPARGMELMSTVYAGLQDMGAEKAINLWKTGGQAVQGGNRQAFGSFIGSQGNAAYLEDLRQSLPADQWKQLQKHIGESWPLEKADALLAYAVSGGSPDVLSSLALANGKKGADWLMEQLASGKLDPATGEAIRKSNDYRNLLENNPHLPFEERLAVMPGQDKELLALQLGGRDVVRALNDGDKDWRFAFRNGKVTYDEVYDAVAATMPELAAASPDSISLQLLKELAEENGGAALEALAHTPEPDKWALALKPTQWNFHNVNPQEFYDYLQHIPNTDPAHNQARLESWVWHSKGNLELYSRDYVDWVKALPEGVDREMAAVGILRSVGQENTELRAEVDALVMDPALRGKIQASK